MPPLVTFPDAVRVAIDGIRPALSPVEVVHDVPNPRPLRFVRLIRTGGVRYGPVSDAAQITVEAWAERTEPADTAINLAQNARHAVHALAGQTVDNAVVYLVEEVGGPAELPDPDSGARRVTFTVLVHIRGT